LGKSQIVALVNVHSRHNGQMLALVGVCVNRIGRDLTTPAKRIHRQNTFSMAENCRRGLRPIADLDVGPGQRGLREGDWATPRDRQCRGAEVHLGLLSPSSWAGLLDGEPLALIANTYSFERQAPKVVIGIKARIGFAERTVRPRRRQGKGVRGRPAASAAKQITTAC
jgi:hypothetical protein